MDEPILRARGVGKRYGGHVALADVDLDLSGGSFVVLLGPNGAGKSTLLGRLAQVVGGSGMVTFAGSTGRPPRGDLGYLPQRLRLPQAATVREIGALLRAVAGSPEDRVTAPPGFVPDPDSRIGDLSGGQAQRVALAGVISGAPKALLLDEPLANLDVESRDAVAAMLCVHRDAGAVVVVAIPAASDILDLADRVLVVRSARLVSDGPPAAVLGRRPGPGVEGVA